MKMKWKINGVLIWTVVGTIGPYLIVTNGAMTNRVHRDFMEAI
jgi:hypothetical protein